MRPVITALLLLTFSATGALAASPNLAGMKPQGGQRGTDVEVTLSGQKLADAKELVFYQPGITLAKIQAVNDGQVNATFRIAPDAPLGLHDFRVRTATGLSRLKTFSVGALKELTEVEPNNDFAAPQPIAMEVTVNGVADNEDVDYYALSAKKGDRITAEVEGIRLGLTLFDPYVAILDSNRFELSSSHVGNFPRPTATVPSGGKVGEPVTVRWIGDVLGEKTTTLTLPASPDRNFGLLAHDERGTAPYPNVFRLSPFGNTIEVEPNDTHPTATPFTPPVALNGVIGAAGDTDHYVFKATKGQTYDVRVLARQIRSPLDSVLTVAARNAGAFAGNDDNGGPDSYLRITAPNDGEFVVAVTDHLKKGGPDYAYRVEISPVVPKLTLSTANEAIQRGTPAVAVSVPRGNRQSILLNAARADFGGDLTLAVAGLPAGVTFEADNMAASTATIPVLFSAEANAPVAAALAKISGKPVDPKVVVPSEFASIVELVLGQNNVPFWTRTVDSLAVAVTDEAPFSIEVVEPKVPLVRGGSMTLKVVARRKPGFTAPIAVALPWNPPGIASNGGITIPEKKDEALIPINANDGAELRTWKVVVDGSSDAGTGRVTVSSRYTRLSVAAQFLTLAFNAVSVEQGKEVDLAVKVNKAVDFPGEAKVTLVGLPNKVTTEVKTITKDTADVVFHLKTDPTSPPGNTGNLFCQVVVTQEGEPIVHNLGTGRLRIDVPLPPKKNAAPAPPPPPPPPVAVAAPKPAAPVAPPKPLSRLEKLRLDNQERAKAATAGAK